MADGTIAPVLQERGRTRQASLSFACAGGRTILLRQHVPYPFHVTRPFHLDVARPDLATLYLQSVSGGVYGGDDLSLALELGAGAAAHVTTQAATIVHDCRGQAAQMTLRARLAQGAFLALTPDPLVLFPGADIATETDLLLHEGGRAVLLESASLHDPLQAGRPFARFHASLTVRDAAGRVRLSDRGGIDGAALDGPAVLGAHRAWASLLVIGPADSLPDPGLLQQQAEAAGCLCGAGAAPGGIGLAARLAGPDGGTLGRCLDRLWPLCAAALLGVTLAPRRK
ncbi:MAG TPA: urease accessory protein UreD [Acetobacteraceae bacterium]|nr:urease accessory protein UreD [Acetobacteraceae bacterium]